MSLLPTLHCAGNFEHHKRGALSVWLGFIKALKLVLEVTPVIYVQHFQNMFTCLVTGAVGHSMQEVGICYWMIYMQGAMCTRYGNTTLTTQNILFIVCVFVNRHYWFMKGDHINNKFEEIDPCRLKDADLHSASEWNKYKGPWTP